MTKAKKAGKKLSKKQHLAKRKAKPFYVAKDEISSRTRYKTNRMKTSPEKIVYVADSSPTMKPKAISNKCAANSSTKKKKTNGAKNKNINNSSSNASNTTAAVAGIPKAKKTKKKDKQQQKQQKPKSKKKNNTKFNLLVDDRTIPFNIQPKSKEEDAKQQSIQQKIKNLIDMGMSQTQATKVLKGKHAHKKSTTTLFKQANKSSRKKTASKSTAASSQQQQKRKLPRLPPIEQFLPLFEFVTFYQKQTIFCDYQDTPWYCGRNGITLENEPFEMQQPMLESSSSSSSSSSNSTGNYVNNQYSSLPLNVQNLLNHELLSFYNYVKLTHDEIQARNYIIDCITQEVKSIFGKRVVRMNHGGTRAQLESRNGAGSGIRWPNQQCGQDDVVQVQTFGSFATAQVSTFWSDIDLAIWGAIDDEDDCGHNHNFLKDISGWDDTNDNCDDDNVDDDDDDDDDDSCKGDGILKMSASSVQRTMELLRHGSCNSHTEITKEARIDRWKSALGVMDAATENNAKRQKLHVVGKDENSFHTDDIKQSGGDKEEKKLDVNERWHIDVTEMNGKDPNDEDNQNSEFLFVIDREGVKEFGGEFFDDEDNDGVNNMVVKNENVISAASGEVKLEEGVNQNDEKIAIKSEIVKVEESEEAQLNEANQENDTDNTQGEGNSNVETSAAGTFNAKTEESDDELINERSQQDHISESQEGDCSHDETSKRSRFYIDIEETDESDSDVDIIEKSGQEIDEEEEDDSVDVMDSYYNRDEGDRSDSDDPDEELKAFAERFESSDGLEININASGIDRGAVARNGTRATMGPKGNTRKMVVKALRILSGKIHQSAFARSVETRSGARVPIICFTTCLGFDGDIALGGHNGTDTSHYVRKQVERYESFAVVTLLLKVLLQQTNLDKPFCGGLGSYKLYVLVAHHYKKHISLGGGTSAGEILLSFLYRYSDLNITADRFDFHTKTDISNPTIISCDGGEADLNSSVMASRCSELFGVCYTRILHSLEQLQSGHDVSLIATIIQSNKLKSARRNCIEMASQWKKMKEPYGRGFAQYSSSGSIGRSSFFFTKSGSNQTSINESGNATMPMRGPRGGWIPTNRPDVDAKPQGLSALLMQGAKNRKNKKKQKRDIGLNDFARDSLQSMKLTMVSNKR